MSRKRKGRLKPRSPRAGGHGVELPLVAIVGRPNVGKSALFNRLVGQEVSIVEQTAGVTRDRVSAVIELADGHPVELMDTGGLGGSDDKLSDDVNRQIAIALEYADAVLLLVDARAGLTPLDSKIARQVSRLDKPIVLAVNKCETAQLEENAAEFWELGIGEPHTISAAQSMGVLDIKEVMAAAFPKGKSLPEDEGAEREMRVAIVGRRNTGKSTYLNAIFGEERVLASPMPGTTRDSVDVRVQLGDLAFTLIDTAGLRRRGRVDDHIEEIAHLRARRAVARADVVLLFIEARNKISLVDKQLAGLIADEHKAVVVVGTKWDEVDGRMGPLAFGDYARKYLQGIAYAPVAALSTLGGLNVEGPIRTAKELYDQSKIRVNTAKINAVVRLAYDTKRPRVKRNTMPRIYFATQIRTNPVTIVLFCNKPSMFTAAYRRFLSNQLRKSLPYSEVPIKFIFRERVNIFERGLHNRIRRIKTIGDDRWLSHEGKEEEPLDATENVDEIFTSLFGEDVQERRIADEAVVDLLELADSNPELFTEQDAPAPADPKLGEHLFDEELDDPAPPETIEPGEEQDS